jgi:ferredoxin/flavodoxin
MKISRKTCFFFSAYGGTERVARLLSERLGIEKYIFNFTSDSVFLDFREDDLVLFCVPVYGGRIPVPIYDRMKDISGKKTPAVVVAVYGNRAVDDAGIEMRDLVSSKGFVVVGYAEFIAPHSLAPQYGAGRPDASDMAVMDHFASGLSSKIESAEKPQPVTVPGNRPYVRYNGSPLKPVVNRSCIQCGECVNFCPAGAVDPDEPRHIDGKKCISCMGCIERCLQGARSVPKPLLAGVAWALRKSCSDRKEPRISL